MAKRTSLDDMKKREIAAILTVGCSLTCAAKYVGCAASTIRRTALRDPEFAEALGKAEQQAEIGLMKNIQKAAKKEQYWRAAAWALERRHPERYAARGPDSMTLQEVRRLLEKLAEVILEELPDDDVRQRVLKRFESINKEMSEWAEASSGRNVKVPKGKGSQESED
jgi:hypothetical protein